MSVPRAELVSSAISFLQDPAVANASLEQRLGFLRSKGLSDAEVAEAMRYAAPAAGTSGSQALQMPAHAQHAYANPYAPDPRLARDWRDWFIMAVVAGSVGYGIVGLARRYLFPHLAPPNADVLTADLDALTDKYDTVAAQLTALERTTDAVRAGVEQQRTQVEAMITDVEGAVREVRDGEKGREAQMKRISDEVEEMKRALPKMMEKQTSSQQTSLSELQTELKSLKSLLVSRAPSAPRYGAAASSGNGPSSPGGAASPRPDGKPSIPSWQLAGSASTASLAAATPAGGSSAGSDEEKATAGGKGKSDEETVVV